MPRKKGQKSYNGPMHQDRRKKKFWVRCLGVGMPEHHFWSPDKAGIRQCERCTRLREERRIGEVPVVRSYTEEM